MSDTAGPSRTTDARQEEGSPKKRNRNCCCCSIPPWLWPRGSEQPSQQGPDRRQAESGNRTREVGPGSSSTLSRSRYIRPWYRDLWNWNIGSEQEQVQAGRQAEQRNRPPDEQTSLLSSGTPEPTDPWDKLCSEFDEPQKSGWGLWDRRRGPLKIEQMTEICNQEAQNSIRAIKDFWEGRERVREIEGLAESYRNDLFNNIENRLKKVAKIARNRIEQICGDSYNECLISKDEELSPQLSQQEPAPFFGPKVPEITFDTPRQNKYPLLHEITNFIVLAIALEKPLTDWHKQRILRAMSAIAENIDRIHNQGLAGAVAHDTLSEDMSP